jgi:hypothetical protein
MVIGFKKQFVEHILTGRKVHTVRDDKGNRWKAGMLMHMYTGGRFSKEYHQFAKKECKGIQDIFTTYFNGRLQITVDDTYLFGHLERTNFAISDGFNDWDDFVKYWLPVIDTMPEKTFKGKVIHWTYFRY